MTSSIRRVLSAHTIAGSEFIITQVHLIFKSILILPGRKLDLSERRMVIAASWPGFHSMEGAQEMKGLAFRVFTEVVEAQLEEEEEGGEGETGTGKEMLLMPQTRMLHQL